MSSIKVLSGFKNYYNKAIEEKTVALKTFEDSFASCHKNNIGAKKAKLERMIERLDEYKMMSLNLEMELDLLNSDRDYFYSCDVDELFKTHSNFLHPKKEEEVKPVKRGRPKKAAR